MRDLVALLAGASTGGLGVSIEGIFLQYGLIGAVAFALGLYARSAIKATEDRCRRLEEDNRRLYQIMSDQMVPALTKASAAVVDATAVLAEVKKRGEIDAAVEAARRLRSHD